MNYKLIFRLGADTHKSAPKPIVESTTRTKLKTSSDCREVIAETLIDITSTYFPEFKLKMPMGEELGEFFKSIPDSVVEAIYVAIENDLDPIYFNPLVLLIPFFIVGGVANQAEFVSELAKYINQEGSD